jgi:hypothetical protein
MYRDYYQVFFAEAAKITFRLTILFKRSEIVNKNIPEVSQARLKPK